MIRVEVTCDGDVTKVVTAFTTILPDQDYEIWLVPHDLYEAGPLEYGATKRAWRVNGLRGAISLDEQMRTRP